MNTEPTRHLACLLAGDRTMGSMFGFLEISSSAQHRTNARQLGPELVGGNAKPAQLVMQSLPGNAQCRCSGRLIAFVAP